MFFNCFMVFPVIAESSANVIFDPSKHAFMSSFVMICALYADRFDYVCFKTGLSCAVDCYGNVLASAVA